jgi:hypothetical protein
LAALFLNLPSMSLVSFCFSMSAICFSYFNPNCLGYTQHGVDETLKIQPEQDFGFMRELKFYIDTIESWNWVPGIVDTSMVYEFEKYSDTSFWDRLIYQDQAVYQKGDTRPTLVCYLLALIIPQVGQGWADCFDRLTWFCNFQVCNSPFTKWLYVGMESSINALMVSSYNSFKVTFVYCFYILWWYHPEGFVGHDQCFLLPTFEVLLREPLLPLVPVPAI